MKIRYNRNDYIQAPRVFVVRDSGEKLGEMTTQEALALAKAEEKDLIEIVPNAKPPVVKIIEWSKFKYDLSKKQKHQKNKSQEQKEIWFKAFIDEGDIQHKIKKVKEFVDKGQRVKLTIRRKGRIQEETFTHLMSKLLEKTNEFSDVLTEPKFSGGNLSAIVGPKK